MSVLVMLMMGGSLETATAFEHHSKVQRRYRRWTKYLAVSKLPISSTIVPVCAYILLICRLAVSVDWYLGTTIPTPPKAISVPIYQHQ
ncbi:hypothetical protein PPL_12044 [Heterostelium album PN500]|uniref:Uncharacterized protein n=1 Tax=Heterostelium pallidum (strain ATCC 26659 / Pp 5 / PN500) TaxID=670386 RepID=D3BLJ1_HETP5|nr:hypothetical protein PPL_12044 [Heterostelium album PN500]EFA77442.1 hypothetical protein PPL_12044 [Heterostelium album PN500]|eukprot:XP_020429570.1 hypothetical protein PPL_12044 [Heterostelium album PN500]